MVRNVTVEVAESVAAVTGADRVRDALVAKLAAALVTKRVEVAARLVAAHESSARELDKVKPKVLAFGANGEPIGAPAFTPQQYQERQKHEKALKRIETLLVQCFEHNKWDEAEKFQPGNTETPDS